MKQKFFLIAVLVLCSLSVAFGQKTRVSNGYGQTLTVTINGETKDIPKNGVQEFSANASNLKLECRTSDGMTFTVNKNVFNNSIMVLPEDGKGAVAGSSSNSTYKNVVSNTPNVRAVQPTQLTYNPPFQSGEKISLIYTGTDPFTIITKVGRGLQFRGADTANDSRKNKYDVHTPTGQNLEIGAAVKLKDLKDVKSILAYVQIRKMLILGDTASIITSKDLQIEVGKLMEKRIQLLAPGYKVVLEVDNLGKISLGDKEVSRKVKLPIGQYLLEISFTDPDGMPHRLNYVFMHDTENESRSIITEKALKNAFEVTTY